MGFLEDVGRGNALSGVNTVMNMAVNLKGLDLQEQRQTQQHAIDIEKLGMLRAQEARTAEIQGVELSKAKNELLIQNANIARRGKTITDIRSHPLMQRFPEETQKAAFEMGVGLGHFDAETGAATVGGVEDFVVLPEDFVDLGAGDLVDVGAGLDQAALVLAADVLDQAERDGDPEIGAEQGFLKLLVGAGVPSLGARENAADRPGQRRGGLLETPVENGEH